MKTLKSLKRELEEFTPKRFNTVYCSLIDVAQTSDREYELLDALSFIASCNLMLEQVNETLKNITDEALVNKPGETHCLMCEAKEKTIQHLENLLKIKDSNLQTLRELKNEAIKELNLLKDNQLKVCEKLY